MMTTNDVIFISISYCLQVIISIIGFLSIIILLRKKRMGRISLVLVLAFWALGAMRIWPIQKLSPYINQCLVLIAETSLLTYVFMAVSRVDAGKFSKTDSE